MSAALEQAMGRGRAWLEAHARSDEASLAAALQDERSAEQVEADFAARQDERGAVRDEGRDAELASARALEWLQAFGRGDGPVAERAAAFLAGRQRDDGGWGGEGDAEAARIERSARVAAALTRTVCVRPSALTRAAGFLLARWSPDRLALGGPDALAAWFPALVRVAGPEGDEALQWCGRELEKGVRSGGLDAPRCARLFVACDAHALPGARLRADQALAELLAAQQPDGDWAGDAETTLEALRALRFLAPAARVAPGAQGASC